ncbi:MAG: uracil-DNA glycosylase family protein [Pirellulaceae bacterium]
MARRPSGNKGTGSHPATRLLDASQRLSQSLQELDFSSVCPWVYNPLEYAWDPYQEYIERFARSGIRLLFLGMNPGPWGMMQTGIPFGEVTAVRDWLQITSQPKKPERFHPKRPVLGTACTKQEVSGKRLWGLFADRFGTPDRFFDHAFVANYCPLGFLAEGAQNLTPDKFPSPLRRCLEEACDQLLQETLDLLQPHHAIGVGGFAQACLQRCAQDFPKIQVGRILHPSPASPAANRGWATQATRELIDMGAWPRDP